MKDLQNVEEIGKTSPFGPHTEKTIIALSFESPEFFATVGNFLSHKYFRMYETSFVMAIIEKLFKETGFVPSRGTIRDLALKELTVDDDYERVLEIIDYEIDKRESAFAKRELLEWVRDRAFGMLYSEDGINAYERHDYDHLEEIFNDARRITDVTTNGFTFFEETQKLFTRERKNVLTCGFPQLDRMIEGGGPSKGEVFCWMAPTGVGKCHTLSSKVWEKKLSQIFEIEVEEDGKTKVVKLAGFRKIETARGIINVYNLTEEDDIIKLPALQDEGDLLL